MGKIKVLLLTLFAIIPLYGFSQINSNSWELLGKISLHRPSYDNEYTEAQTQSAFLYGKYNGNVMVYKIFVTIDNKSYIVSPNPDYNKSKVEYCNERSRTDKYFKGPWPKIKEKYPQKAGRYYLDAVQVSQID